MKREDSILLAAPIAALIVNFMLLQDAAYRIPFLSFLLLLAAAFTVCLYAEMKNVSEDTKKTIFKSCGLVFITLGMIHAVCIFRQAFFKNPEVLFKWTCILAMILGYIIFILIYTNKKITEDTVFLILLAGICIRVAYVVLMQAHLYQNDAGTLATNYGGQLGYIYHFYSKSTLPAIDPRKMEQFYHPPLHHMLAAAWLKVNNLLGKSMGGMDELLQSLTLFYSGCTLGFLNKIGIKLKISCKGRCIALGMASFLPFGIMMAGAVSNDGLMLLFDVMAIYFTLKWFEEPIMKNILLTAITVGCAMMTKLSGGLIIPAVAVVMLMKLFGDRQRMKRYIVQFFCFVLVVFPLGMWYPLRGLIKYGVPITYTPPVRSNAAEYIGEYGVIQRLFGTGGQFYPLYVGFDNKTAGISYNIPISIVKFLTFGDGTYYLQNNVAKNLGTWVFYLTVVLLALAFVGMIAWLFKKRTELYARMLVLISVLVITISYFKSCFEHPHVSIMHVRFIMLPVYLCFLGLGGFFTEEEERRGMSVVRKGLLGLALLYIVLSTLLFFNMQVTFSS